MVEHTQASWYARIFLIFFVAFGSLASFDGLHLTP